MGTEQLARVPVPDLPAQPIPDVNDAPSPDKLAQVSALLRGEPSPVPVSGDPQGMAGVAGGDDLARLSASLETDQPAQLREPGERVDPLESLDALAQTLGVEAANLYQVKVPTRDGETITLGELKDYHAQRGEHEVERLAWEEQRVTEQADLARSRQELAELLSAVPRDKLRPEIIERVRQVHETRMAVERSKLLDRVPEWKDDAKRSEEMDKIAGHLADYGIPKSALAEITDHRLLVYMRDNMARKARLDAALAQVREVRTPPPPGSSKPPVNKSGSTRQGQPNGPQAQRARLGEISKLLRGE
jgi:hypothetical protein